MSTSGNDKYEKAMAKRAEAIMADTQYRWLRTRRARVALAVTMIAIIVIMSPAWIYLRGIGGFLVALAIGVLWMLRTSVRHLADLPVEYLDERQSTLRDRAHVSAYSWLGGAAVVATCALLVAFLARGEVEDWETWTITLSFNGVMGVLWATQAAVLSIPSIVLALRERELPS